MTAPNFAASAVIAAAVLVAPLGAQAASLYDNKTINNGLVAVGIADEIRKNCPSISARFARAVSFIKSLERQARAQGFSQAEIDAYVDDKAQKAKLEARAEAWLASKGATSEEGFCKVGRAEIAAKSQIGALLKAN